MLNRFDTIFYAIIMLGMVLLISGCGASGEEQDIESVASLEAQAISEQDSAISTPTPTELPTELVEQVSPVSPIAPTPQAAEPSGGSAPTVEPITGGETALKAAIADLVKVANVSPDGVNLVAMEETEWSDTSLGCPEEGMMYAQVVTPGYLIVLESDGQQYTYHTDQATSVVLCEESP